MWIVRKSYDMEVEADSGDTAVHVDLQGLDDDGYDEDDGGTKRCQWKEKQNRFEEQSHLKTFEEPSPVLKKKSLKQNMSQFWSNELPQLSTCPTQMQEIQIQTKILAKTYIQIQILKLYVIQIQNMTKCWLNGLSVFDLRHLLKYKYMQIQVHVNTIKDTLQMLTVKIVKHVTMFIEGGFTAVYCLIWSICTTCPITNARNSNTNQSTTQDININSTCPTQMQEIQIQFKIHVTML